MVAVRASKARRELPFRLRNSQKAKAMTSPVARRLLVGRSMYVHTMYACMHVQTYKGTKNARGSPLIRTLYIRFPRILSIVESYLTFKGVRSFLTHPAHASRVPSHTHIEITTLRGEIHVRARRYRHNSRGIEMTKSEMIIRDCRQVCILARGINVHFAGDGTCTSCSYFNYKPVHRIDIITCLKM